MNPWNELSDVALSMVLSHAAGGGSFCCDLNLDVRQTITKSKRKQRAIAAYAYHELGHRGQREKLEDWTRNSAYFFEKIERSM